MNVRALVCGGRLFADSAALNAELDKLKPDRVIQGGATGADMLARVWCVQNRVLCDTYFADWRKHGRSAGPKRNERMLRESAPSIVVACRGGRGTADMVNRALDAGVPVTFVGWADLELEQFFRP